MTDNGNGQNLSSYDAEAGSLPTAKAEDVEFSGELADEEDRIAQQRAREADARAAEYKGD